MPQSALSGRSQVRNSLLLIERFSRRIDGFNSRRLTLRDLDLLCSLQNIDVVFTRLRGLHGAALENEGYKYLYINSLLSEPEQVIAGFHEYCHLTDQVVDSNILLSTGGLWNVNKYERQAQIVGVVALMPKLVVEGMTVGDLMHEFGVRREIAEFRLSLMI